MCSFEARAYLGIITFAQENLCTIDFSHSASSSGSLDHAISAYPCKLQVDIDSTTLSARQPYPRTINQACICTAWHSFKYTTASCPWRLQDKRLLDGRCFKSLREFRRFDVFSHLYKINNKKRWQTLQIRGLKYLKPSGHGMCINFGMGEFPVCVGSSNQSVSYMWTTKNSAEATRSKIIFKERTQETFISNLSRIINCNF